MSGTAVLREPGQLCQFPPSWLPQRVPQHHEFDAHGGTIVAGRPGTPLVHGKAAQRACLENELVLLEAEA
eukprot:scaffold179512_cov15-Tisochrysis_lutea.AAC.1